ncbi:MAG: ABC transporter ATP-binding protein [Paludibacteraceae bacterium]|nr:ABC transporter ATP-binding protein [Paludibacteraceae bacterium]
MITCQDLTIGYADKVVQQHLNFSLQAGELVAMLGPNGSGKSTLLRTLAALQPALGGSYTVLSCTTDIRVPLSKQLALVLTERVSLDKTSVHDIVAMGRHPYTSFLGGLTEEDESIIADSLREVNMSDYRQKMFNELSDGESQRVLIAKAIAQQTPVILLDEPTAHLDLPNRIRTLQLLRRLAHEHGKTILISTHELDLALAMSDRILLLSSNGMALDTAEALKKADAFTPAFGMDIFHPLP